MTAAITAGEWLVTPGKQYAPHGKWSCTDCGATGDMACCRGD
jgi:hypothetical protein